MQPSLSDMSGEDRVGRLKRQVQEYERGICPERALLWTEYFKNRQNKKKPVTVRIAEATRHVLLNKSVNIYPDELIVGNFTSLRVGGIIYPELHGVPVLLEILKYPTRKVNPLKISHKDQWRLASILPFWLTRFLVPQAFPNPLEQIRFSWEQLRARDYAIYEAAGIAHLAPDHEKLIRLGTDEIKRQIEDFRKRNTDPAKEDFYASALIAAEALACFGERYAQLATTIAAEERDSARRAELQEIAAVCARVPRHGAQTFREAVQSMFFLHLAIFQESVGETICPGRIDQILYPYYRRDCEAGRITPQGAQTILAAFCIKLCETIPVYSQAITSVAGGMTSWEVVTIGGTDSEGRDATNELSYLLVDIANKLRMRQPNFHARLHKGSPAEFVQKINRALASGSNTPSLFNDEVIVPSMVAAGYDLHDARGYVAIGCVEPTAPGKTLGSTDAAILNVPVAMELTLNQGRRFGEWLRSGIATAPATMMKTMDDVAAAFTAQLEYLVGRMIADLQCIERANAKCHPTPLTSLFLEGCIENGTCSTAGGARYNFSGLQAVGVTTAGDSLYAIERAVFLDKKISLEQLIEVLAAAEPDPYWFALLRELPKFGNDDARADYWTDFVIRAYTRILNEAGKNTRGGKLLPGLYSNTAHVHFGKNTGALPCGRKRGEPFPSGMAPQNGMDRLGPTALLNSMNRIDFTPIANGINFNLKFDANHIKGDSGLAAFAALIAVYFKRGGMQVQMNVMDPSVLREAKAHPELYPFLLVRLSGYSSYFADLSPEVQDEVIARTCNAVG